MVPDKKPIQWTGSLLLALCINLNTYEPGQCLDHPFQNNSLTPTTYYYESNQITFDPDLSMCLRQR
jgi:hypothetical protein